MSTTFHDAQKANFKALCTEYDGLYAKANLTDDEKRRLAALPDEMASLKKELEASIERDRKVAEMKGFLDSDDKVAPVSTETAELLTEYHSRKTLTDRVEAARTSWTPGAGSERMIKTAFGNMVPMESEGAGVDEVQWKAISTKAYLKTFEKYLRVGIQNMSKDDLKTLEPGLDKSVKTLSEGADSGGGYLVPPEFFMRLIARKAYPTRIREFVTTVPCSRDQVFFPRINNDSDTADIYAANSPRIQWIGEKGPTPSQTDIAFGDVIIQIYTGQFYVEVSRNLMEDAQIAISAIIEKFAAQAYELGLDNAIISGTGNGQPTGILTNAGAAGLYCPTVNCGNPISANGLTNLVYGLPPQYSDADNCAALMERTSGFATFAQIQDNSGQYIFGLARENGPQGMAVARRPELFGYPTVFSAFMPHVGAGNTPVAFGDWSEVYTFCQRVGLSVFSYGDQDKSMLLGNKVGWLFRFRCGGMVTQSRAGHIGVQS